MARPLEQRLDSIETKARIIVANYERMQRARQKADERVAELLRQVEEQSREIADLRRQVEYMKVASTLAPSSEALDESRRVLSEIVREIDKCINDLTRTP
ncbi:MAG: hypothetical protein NC336_00920 [Clostridium sp.]|nr:hypothetical protein [Clostridium sp.]